jgi:hypothetical protein
MSRAATGRLARVRRRRRALVAVDSLGRHGDELRDREGGRTLGFSSIWAGWSFSLSSTGGTEEEVLWHT